MECCPSSTLGKTVVYSHRIYIIGVSKVMLHADLACIVLFKCCTSAWLLHHMKGTNHTPQKP